MAKVKTTEKSVAMEYREAKDYSSLWSHVINMKRCIDLDNALRLDSKLVINLLRKRMEIPNWSVVDTFDEHDVIEQA